MEAAKEELPKSKTLELRKRHIGESCKLFFSETPIKIVRGEDQYLFDETGKKYLDCINNVAHVGHCHPDVVQAAISQMTLLNTNNRFLHDNLVLCAQKLASLFPDPLNVCFFVNSGSEANDLAYRLAKAHTKCTDVITVDHAYHGHLSSLIDISPYKVHANQTPDWVHVVPCPDVYRGKYRDKDYPNECLGKKYAEETKQVINKVKEEGRGICAFIMESLQSCGGQIIPPPNYMKYTMQHLAETKAVTIFDEVQVGFGRVGKHWWGFQLQGEDIVPDIVTVGKAMGNGHPVAAVITTLDISASFKATGIEYFNTFGGNPVSCAVARTVIEIVENDKLRENAVTVGNHLLNSLRHLMNTHKLIGDVRGVGLFIGIELVTDRVTRTPATAEAQHVVSRMKEELVLISSDGPDRNVLKLKPPMTFTIANADLFVSTLDQVLTELKDCNIETQELTTEFQVRSKKVCGGKKEDDNYLNMLD